MSENVLWMPPSRRMIANVADTQYDIVLEVCEDVLDWKLIFERDLKEWDLYWTDMSVSTETLSRMKSHQKINHFPGMSSLSRKNTLAKNIRKMQEGYEEEYSFLPKTWLLPQDLSPFKRFLTEARSSGRRKVFIVKPEAGSQGRGIYISHSDSEFRFNDPCVVQLYISRPLLFQQLKFDLRVYILVAGCDPLRAYIYNEGLVRFSTEEYEPPSDSNYRNLFMHLTNYSINKKHPSFLQNQSESDMNFGHKRSLAEFFRTLKAQGVNSASLWSQIKDIAAKTLISAQPFLAHEYRVAQPNNPANNMCFEVLGLDFMIQKDQQVFLLEVNHSPSFKCDSPLDHLVKTNLVADTIELININTESRNDAMYEAFLERDLRIKTGKRTSLNRVDRERFVEEAQSVRDQYEEEHCGSYEKIFPSPDVDLQAKYTTLLGYSSMRYNNISPLLGRQKANTRQVGRGAFLSLPRKRVIALITESESQESSIRAGRSPIKSGVDVSLPRLRSKNISASQSPLLYGSKFPPPEGSKMPLWVGDISILQFSKGPGQLRVFSNDLTENTESTTVFSRQHRR